jgi:hypothetical protein
MPLLLSSIDVCQPPDLGRFDAWAGEGRHAVAGLVLLFLNPIDVSA